MQQLLTSSFDEFMPDGYKKFQMGITDTTLLARLESMLSLF